MNDENGKADLQRIEKRLTEVSDRGLNNHYDHGAKLAHLSGTVESLQAILKETQERLRNLE